MDKLSPLDEYVIDLIGRAMPLGLSEAEILVSTLGDDFDGDLVTVLTRLSQAAPPRLRLDGLRWKLCGTASPRTKNRPLILGTGRDPGRAFGLGGGMAMVVLPRGGRSS